MKPQFIYRALRQLGPADPAYAFYREISVKLERAGSRRRAEVTLPAGLSGELSWRGVQRTLAPDANVLTIDGASK
jgi:hypothetical protein